MSAKVCQNCQTENDVSAKFCYQCGTELPEQIESKQICTDCGIENPEDAKFCASCGVSLSGRATDSHPTPKQPRSSPKQPVKRRKKKSKPASAVKPQSRRRQKVKKTKDPLMTGLLILGAILIIFFYVKSIRQADKLSDPYVEQLTGNVDLESRVRAVASKFVCACGSCPKEPLETCACPTARRERDFIRNALYSGQAEDEVIAVLNKKYGGLKANDQSIPGGGKVNLTIPAPVDLNSADNDAIASFTNRAEIIAHFTCPCGQCEMDELKDCDCEHPNGATEVKRFIDEKINEGSYTVAGVVELVENKYGGKIR